MKKQILLEKGIASYKGNPPCPSPYLMKWAKRKLSPVGSEWMKGVISRYLAWALLDNPRRMAHASPSLVHFAQKVRVGSEREVVQDYQDLFLAFDVHFARALKVFGREKLDRFKYFDSKGKPKTVKQVMDELRRPGQGSSGIFNVETEEAEKIMDCAKGFAWWRIERGYSIVDSRYLSHCGNLKQDNTGELEPERTGDVLYSLRKKVVSGGKTSDLPKLTFVVDRQGYLGEAKGYANSIPSPKFHAFVVDLLSLPFLKGIKGGGQHPQTNFRFSDLSKKQKKTVLSKNSLLRFDPIGTNGITEKFADADGRWVIVSEPEFPDALEFWKEVEWLGEELGLLCYQSSVTLPRSCQVFWETKAVVPYLKSTRQCGRLQILSHPWNESERDEAFDLLGRQKEIPAYRSSIFSKALKFITSKTIKSL